MFATRNFFFNVILEFIGPQLDEVLLTSAKKEVLSLIFLRTEQE